MDDCLIYIIRGAERPTGKLLTEVLRDWGRQSNISEIEASNRFLEHETWATKYMGENEFRPCPHYVLRDEEGVYLVLPMIIVEDVLGAIAALEEV